MTDLVISEMYSFRHVKKQKKTSGCNILFLFSIRIPLCLGNHHMMLLKGKAEHEKKDKESVFLDFTSPEKLKDVPSPRVISCHYLMDLTPNGVLKRR